MKNLILNIIVKLGSGTSLPGILAAKCGGNVTLSDSEDLPHCLENCRKSCQANGLLDIPVIGITWGRFNEALLDLPPVDIILGSDCFYDSKGQNLYLPHIWPRCKTLLHFSLSFSLMKNGDNILPWSFYTFVLFLFSLIDFEDIIVTVSYLIKQNKDAEFWCTYQERR